MTAQSNNDIDRRARQVQVDAQEIENALARRHGALPPGEHCDVLAILSATVTGIPGLAVADPERQLDAAELLLDLWCEMLLFSGQVFWQDPDTEDC